MGAEEKQIRVLLAKPGLDGHDRGVRLVARALRDAGVETVFLGVQVTADHLVQAALEESVDVIGLSIFSGGHMILIPRIMTQSDALNIIAIIRPQIQVSQRGLKATAPLTNKAIS